jgi:hypothetical protein
MITAIWIAVVEMPATSRAAAEEHAEKAGGLWASLRK